MKILVLALIICVNNYHSVPTPIFIKINTFVQMASLRSKILTLLKEPFSKKSTKILSVERQSQHKNLDETVLLPNVTPKLLFPKSRYKNMASYEQVSLSLTSKSFHPAFIVWIIFTFFIYLINFLINFYHSIRGLLTGSYYQNFQPTIKITTISLSS